MTIILPSGEKCHASLVIKNCIIKLVISGLKKEDCLIKIAEKLMRHAVQLSRNNQIELKISIKTIPFNDRPSLYVKSDQFNTCEILKDSKKEGYTEHDFAVIKKYIEKELDVKIASR